MSDKIAKLLTHRSPIAAFLVFASLVLMLFASSVAPARMFVQLLVLLTVIMLVLGWAIKDRFIGILINERNVMSLSRFQMVGWTIVVLAAYFTYAFVRNAKAIGRSAECRDRRQSVDAARDQHDFAGWFRACARLEERQGTDGGGGRRGCAPDGG